MTDTSRDDKGKFVKGKSGNAAGRPRNSKGKYSKAKYENMINRAGPEALELVMQAARDLIASGQLASGAKILIPILNSWYSLTIYNDKIQIAEEKGKKAQDEDDEESFEGNVFQVSFSSTAQ